jgi:Ca2+-binding RTX toxin-like protein
VFLNAGRVFFTPKDDFLGEAGFTYVVEDEAGARAEGRVDVQVIPLIDPPRARDDRFETIEDNGLLIYADDLLDNDFVDPAATVPSIFWPRIVELDRYPENGDIALTERGDVIFMPKANFNGDASFFYTLQDFYGQRSTAEVFVEISPDNDDPFVVNDEGPFVVEEDEQLLLSAFELFANDGDPDGDVLQFGGVEAENGSVRRAGEDLIFTPDEDYVGDAAVIYKAVDGKGGESERSARVTIEVVSVEDAPEARDDRVDGFEGAATTISFAALLENDRDGDGDGVSVFSVDLDAPVNGTLAETDGGVIYTPDAGFWGEDAFTYVIEDTTGALSEAATVTVDVAPDNLAPEPGEDRFDGVEDEPLIIDIADLLANDVDADGDPLTFVDFEPIVENGRAARLPGDRLSLSADVDFSGLVEFTYTVTDGIWDPVEGRIIFDVASVFDAPRPRDDSGVFTRRDEAVTIDPADLLANDLHPERSDIFLDRVEAPLRGTVDVVDDLIVFTPEAGFIGTAAFTYVVRDAQGGEGSAQVSVAVQTFQPQDDLFQMQEDARLSFAAADLLDNDLYPDGAAQLQWVDFAVGGEVSALDGGGYAFDPDPDFTGQASFRYRAVDGAGTEAEAEARITVTAVNDAPVFADPPADVEADELAPLFLPAPGATDAEGDALTFALRGAEGVPAPDWLSVDPATGEVRGTPPRGSDGLYALELVASDGLLETASLFVLTVADTAGDLIEGTEDGETLEGTELPDVILALEGDDVARPGLGADEVTLGEGADALRGPAEDLHRDLLLDFTRYDEIFVEGAAFDTSDVLLTPLPVPLAVGLDDPRTELSVAGLQVGSESFVMRLGGEVLGRAVTATAEAGGTRLTIANGAPRLLEATAVVAHFNTVSGDLLATAEDPDGDPLMLTALNGEPFAPGETLTVGDGAQLTVEADGSWAFDPGRGYDELRPGESAELRVAYAVGDGTDETEGELVLTIAGSALGRRDVGGGGRDVLRGTAKDDVLNGAGGPDQVLGLNGKDVLRGGAGNDRVDGGGGADVARGDAGKDRVDGRGGNDDLFGGGGADRLFGGGGADELRGGGGKDRLDGANGADKLFGEGANDRLDGGKGKDLLVGGAGKDVFFFSRGDGADTVRDWQDGRDKIEIGRGANAFAKLDIDQNGKHALIEYGKRGDVIKLLKTDADDLDASDFIF